MAMQDRVRYAWEDEPIFKAVLLQRKEELNASSLQGPLYHGTGHDPPPLSMHAIPWLHFAVC